MTEIHGYNARLRIPNPPDTGRVLDEGDLERMLYERPTFLTNRYYVLDRERFARVPLPVVIAGIMHAELDGDSIVLYLHIPDKEIAGLMAEHGDPAPGYAAVDFGVNALRFVEVGLAPPPGRPALVAEVRRLMDQADDAATEGRRLLELAIELRAQALAAVPTGARLSFNFPPRIDEDFEIERGDDGAWTAHGVTIQPQWVEENWQRGNLSLAPDGEEDGAMTRSPDPLDDLKREVFAMVRDRTPDAAQRERAEIEQLARAAMQEALERGEMPLTSADRAEVAGAVAQRILDEA